MENPSNFYKHAVGLLRVEIQKLNRVTDVFALHCHQTVGHGEHLGNVGRQPERGEGTFSFLQLRVKYALITLSEFRLKEDAETFVCICT